MKKSKQTDFTRLPFTQAPSRHLVASISPRFKGGVTILCVAIFAGALGACKKEDDGPSAGSAPKNVVPVGATRVETAVLEPRSLNTKLVRPGEIKGGREATLAAALGGYVENVLVKTGTNVRKNQVILRVDSQVHAAQARLTKVELDDATREIERTKILGKAATSSRVDAANARLERAKAQHSLSMVKQNRAVVRAPFAGTIVGLSVETGEVLAPGAPVARLIQLSPVRVAASVPDRDIASLNYGDKAYVTAASVPTPREGTIDKIEKAADAETRAYMVEAVIEGDATGLLPGMIAEVSFPGHSASTGLFIPQEFLVTRRTENGVFVVKDSEEGNGIAAWQPVTLGRILGTDVEVESGVKIGDEIVVVGHRDLSNGDKLIVSRKGVCCTNGRVSHSAPASQGKDAQSKAPAPKDGKIENAAGAK